MQFKEKEKSKTQCFNKKVALLTFHHSFNYGAVCQTYATCRALQRLGYDVEIIDLRIVGECNSNSVWFLFRLNLYKYNFFFLDLQMLLKAVFGCVQGRRGTSRLYTLAHIWEVPFLCV